MDRSTPVLDRLKHWLLSTGAQEPPSSGFTKAPAYVINQWVPLMRFLQDGRLVLNNNVREQQLRDIALGALKSHAHLRTASRATAALSDRCAQDPSRVAAAGAQPLGRSLEA